MALQSSIYNYGSNAGSILATPTSIKNPLSSEDVAARTQGGFIGQGGYQDTTQNSAQAMQWIPQSVKSSTTSATRSIGEMPSLDDEKYAYEELDEDKVRSRTQEFSALGRREARSNFQDLLSRIYGANPDDPYAKDLARKASQGFSMDTQRAISAGGREALSAGLNEQQQRNQRRMTAYQAAVNAVLGSATATTTQTKEYEPTPLQAMPDANLSRTGGQPAMRNLIGSDHPLFTSRYNQDQPESLGQPYTYG